MSRYESARNLPDLMIKSAPWSSLMLGMVERIPARSAEVFSEKDVVLAIALALRDALGRRGRYSRRADTRG